MMKRKLNIQLTAAFIALIFISGAIAQDIRYTQIYSNPLRLNPAIMGANYHMNFKLGYRSQWTSVGNGFNTAQFTYMMPVLIQDKGHKLDLGVSAMSDEAGAFSTFDGALSVGYALKLSGNGHFLSASVLAGYVQNTLDDGGLTFDEQYQQGSFSEMNPNGENLLTNNTSYIDAGMGVMWFYNPDRDSLPDAINAFAGVSAYHINNPNISLTEGNGKLPMRLTTIAGVKIFTNGKLDFSPQMRFDDQDGAGEFSTGLYTGYRINDNLKAALGIWYRDENAFAFILGISWKYFNLGYSYDLPGSEFSSGIANGSVNEITLGFKLDQASKKGVIYNPSPFEPY